MALKAAIIPVTPFVQNCSLIWCDETNSAAVIDPGGDLDKIQKAIADQGVNLEKILITHGHLDHAGGTAELAEQTNVPVIGPHIDDKFWIDMMEAQGQQFGMTGGRVFTPNQWLQDKDQVKVGNVTLNVVHCPGHTPGHVVFVSLEDRLAFVGDVLFKGSIGRTDFPKGNAQDLTASITDKLWPLGDDILFVCGHGPTSTFGAERQSNPFVADHVLSPQ